MMKKQVPILNKLLIGVVASLCMVAVTIKYYHLRHEKVLFDEKAAFHFYAGGNQDTLPTTTDRSADDWKKNLSGYWQGSINDDLRLLYRITAAYGQVFAYSLDQGAGFIPATATKFDEETKEVRFFFETIGGMYQATLDPTGQELIGKWKQNGHHLRLNMHRFQQPPSNQTTAVVPHEFQFLIEKIVTGDPEQLVEMEGFWSGYLDDSFDDDDKKKEPPELVIFQVEKVSNDLVEPKIFLPNETDLPIPVRSFVFNKPDGQTKIVLDDPEGGNAIFQGKLDEDGTKLIGVVKYDDVDYTPPLTLKWRKQSPSHTDTDFKDNE